MPSENEIGPVALPPELITVTPQPDSLEFCYQRSANGTDLLSVLINDERVGALRLTLTVSTAQFAAATLTAMIADIDTLRDQWNRRDLPRT
jgi:hypothetical protein